MDIGCHDAQMSWQGARWHVCLLDELLISGNNLTSANEGSLEIRKFNIKDAFLRYVPVFTML